MPSRLISEQHRVHLLSRVSNGYVREQQCLCHMPTLRCWYIPQKCHRLRQLPCRNLSARHWADSLPGLRAGVIAA